MWLMSELGNALSAFANSKMEKMGCPDHSHYLVCPLPHSVIAGVGTRGVQQSPTPMRKDPLTVTP
jgi:hypothetical protein